MSGSARDESRTEVPAEAAPAEAPPEETPPEATPAEVAPPDPPAVAEPPPAPEPAPVPAWVHHLEVPWLSEVRPVTRREPPPSCKDPYATW
jgi:hypothetical protein